MKVITTKAPLWMLALLPEHNRTVYIRDALADRLIRDGLMPESDRKFVHPNPRQKKKDPRA